MFAFRIVSWLFAMALTFAAIDAFMIHLNDGKLPEPISYNRWTKALLNGR